MGIEADLIVMHPYDRWGFAQMTKKRTGCFILEICAGQIFCVSQYVVGLWQMNMTYLTTRQWRIGKDMQKLFVKKTHIIIYVLFITVLVL